MNVTVADLNTLAYTNNVTAADNWLIALSEQNVQPCWMDSWPVGLAVASGHYTSSNITAAKLLDLVNPGVTYSCSLTFTSGYPAGYLFQPNSVTASAYRCQLSLLPHRGRFHQRGRQRVLESGRGLHELPQRNVHGLRRG